MVQQTRPDRAQTTRALAVGATWIAVVVAYAVLSNVWVGADEGWYDAIEKPPWQPPGWVFGVIWPLNFLALGVTGVALARTEARRTVPVLVVLAVSVVLAVTWSYLFYVPHALVGSAAALAGAAVLTWVVLGMSARVVAWTGLVLAPYALWVTLATSLAVWYAVSL